MPIAQLLILQNILFCNMTGMVYFALKVKCFGIQCSAALNSHLNACLLKATFFTPWGRDFDLFHQLLHFFSFLLILLAGTFNLQSMEEQNSDIKHKSYSTFISE